MRSYTVHQMLITACSTSPSCFYYCCWYSVLKSYLTKYDTSRNKSNSSYKLTQWKYFVLSCLSLHLPERQPNVLALHTNLLLWKRSEKQRWSGLFKFMKAVISDSFLMIFLQTSKINQTQATIIVWHSTQGTSNRSFPNTAFSLLQHQYSFTM